MRHILSWLVVSIMVISLWNCDNSNPVENNFPRSVKLSKIITNELNYTDFIYDDTLLVKINKINNGEVFETIDIDYNENGQLIKQWINNKFIDDIYSVDYNYSYSDTNMIVEEINSLDNSKKHYHLNSKNQIISKTHFDENDSLITQKFFHYDEMGDLDILITFNKDASTTCHEKYILYDGKTNPFAQFKNLYFLESTSIKSNILHYTFLNTQSNYLQNINFVYEYNAYSYPKKRTKYVNGSKSTEEVYEYIIK